MKNTGCCPKCHSRNIVRVLDNAHRYLAHSIAITKVVTVERVLVARYVCCDCGYVESWVEKRQIREPSILKKFLKIILIGFTICLDIDVLCKLEIFC